MRGGAVLETRPGLAARIAAGAFVFDAHGRPDEGPGRDRHGLAAWFGTADDLSRRAETRLAAAPNRAGGGSD